jgi:HEAT repeat protein
LIAEDLRMLSPFRRLLVLSLQLSLFLHANAVPAQKGGPAKEPPAIRDALGRVTPWGPEVNGARLCVQVVRTRLLYGEPIEVLLHTLNPARKGDNERGPFVRVYWDGPSRTVQVKFTTWNGEAVPFTLQSFGYSSSLDGDYHVVRLWPQGKFARGRYLTPGSYRLSVEIDATNWQKLDDYSWVGRLTAPTVELEVVEGGPKARHELVPPALRQKAEGWIRDLDDKVFATREAAEKQLAAVVLDVLPLLEEALDAPQLEQAMRARRVLRELLTALVKSSAGFAWRPIWHEGGPVLAYLGEPSWQLLAEEFNRQLPPAFLALAAAYGPVDPPEALDKVTAERARQLAVQLEDNDVKVRLRTLRSLSRTTNETILKALVGRLADPFSYIVAGPGDPFPYLMVAYEAQQAIAWQGKPAVPSLVAFGTRGPAQFHREAIEVLGRIEADPLSLKFLGEVMNSPEYDDRWQCVETLKKLGPPAAPLLYRAAQDAKEHPNVRREAITGLGRNGDARTHGAFLIRMLRDDNHDLARAAAEALGKLPVRDALPILAELVRDQKAPRDVRTFALTAYRNTAERKEAEAFLLELLDANRGGEMRELSMIYLAHLNCRNAVPQLLDALDDPERHMRGTADYALRVLSGQRKGVGYDPRRPDSGPWRTWWQKQK